ncbi:MAG: hypothetical protein ACKPEA_14030 [Planctomycetota bacterium]
MTESELRMMTISALVLSSMLCAAQTVEIQHDYKPGTPRFRRRGFGSFPWTDRNGRLRVGQRSIYNNPEEPLNRDEDLIFDAGIKYLNVPSTLDIRKIAFMGEIPNDIGFVGRSELAYRYRFTSIFTLNVWTYEGGFVLHCMGQWIPVSPEGQRRLIAAGFQLPQVPLAYTIPPGAFLVGAGLGAWLWWKWRWRHHT